MEKSNLEKALEAVNLEDLGIKPPTTGDGKVAISRDKLPSFKEVLKKYIMPLEGKEVQLLKGKNKILRVTEDQLTRRSINNRVSDVPMEIFEYTYNKLVGSPNGEIKRVDDILAYAKEKYHSLSSSIIVGVLAQAVPFISRVEESKGLRLILK